MLCTQVIKTPGELSIESRLQLPFALAPLGHELDEFPHGARLLSSCPGDVETILRRMALHPSAATHAMWCGSVEFWYG